MQNAGLGSGVFFALGLTLLLGPGSASIGAMGPQELLRVLFLNETGFPLERPYVSVDSAEGGVDVLAAKTLGYGALMGFYVHVGSQGSRLFVTAVDRQGRVYRVDGTELRVQGATVVEVSVRHLRRGEVPPSSVGVYVSNVTNRVFSYLFFAPMGAEVWGFDILSDTALFESGASRLFHVALPADAPTRGTEWEFLALAKDQSVVQRRVLVPYGATEHFIDIMPVDLR